MPTGLGVENIRTKNTFFCLFFHETLHLRCGMNSTQLSTGKY